RATCHHRRQHDPVRDAALRHIGRGGDAESRATKAEPYERERARGVRLCSGEDEGGQAGDSEEGRPCSHGARGAAVARAETVKLVSPTMRSSTVEKLRWTRTETAPDVAVACAWTACSLVRADSAAVCAA